MTELLFKLSEPSYPCEAELPPFYVLCGGNCLAVPPTPDGVPLAILWSAA